MTCYRSRDNWHSYVKHSLSEIELNEMASHLMYCPECRGIVVVIEETLDKLSQNKVSLSPPLDIKINVMKSIDKNQYGEKLAGMSSIRLSELRNWGLSMIAAGVLLFTLNLSTLRPSFESGQMTELQAELSNQITIPFDKLSQAANNAFSKIESLTLSKSKVRQPK